MIMIGDTQIDRGGDCENTMYVGNQEIDKNWIKDRVVYASYAYPCVSENNMNPITKEEILNLPFSAVQIGDQTFTEESKMASTLYLSRIPKELYMFYTVTSVESDKYQLITPKNTMQILWNLYGGVVYNGSKDIALCTMCNPASYGKVIDIPSVDHLKMGLKLDKDKEYVYDFIFS